MNEPLLRPAEIHSGRALEHLDDRALHILLARLNEARLQPAEPTDDRLEQLDRMHRITQLEDRFLDRERRAVAESAALAPWDPEGFAAWFDLLVDEGPGQHDPLFDFLAEEATVEQMQWFLEQELATEAGFEDLVALTQLRMPQRAKLELARNYWDEMGRGKARGMHGPMLDSLAKALGVTRPLAAVVVWESLALSNTLAGLAHNRCYAYHSLGALGVVELTAPSRATKICQGLDRLGIDGVASRYFRLHAVVDVRHAQTWRDEIFVPMVRAEPRLAEHFAQGALMRLRAGARTFERYRRHFESSTSSASHTIH